MFSHDCRVTPVLGYQPADLLGKSAFDFYHPEDKAHMKDTFDQGIAFNYQWKLYAVYRKCNFL